MIASERVRLRARTVEDADALYELYADPEIHLITNSEPYLPRSLAQLRSRFETWSTDGDGKYAAFVAESAQDGSVLGGCSLWGIDQFNRYAHIGVMLLPKAQGRGYGTEIVHLLCRYAFRMRNLHRVELETFATNTGMRRTAENCGFTLEATLREREYDGEDYVDVCQYGLLRREWAAATGNR